MKAPSYSCIKDNPSSLSRDRSLISIARLAVVTWIITASLMSPVVSHGADGLFGTYFERMTGPCAPGTILTGIDNSPGTYGNKTCTPLSALLAQVYPSATSTAPTGQAVIGFTSTGALRFAPVNWTRSGSMISYTGSRVGIGTANPQAMLEVNGDAIINGLNIGRSTNSINNTLFGRNALSANTGISNTAIGDSTLRSNTLGFYNTANGVNALRLNTFGSYNAAYGVDALYSNITGDGNIANGVNALRLNSTGNNNIALGQSAGSNLRSGNNNIFIGSNVQPNISNTSSNQLNIGNWIYGNNGNIGIGVRSPGERLHVNGNAIFSGTISVNTPTASNHVATKAYVDNNGGLTTTGIIFNFERTCNGRICSIIRPGDMHGANWYTQNVTTMSFRCSGPSSSSWVNRDISMPLMMEENYETYGELIRAGWIPGNYSCITTLTGTDNSVKKVAIPFTIAPSTSAEIYFTRECNGVPCTTIKPGVQHAANWTTVNTRKLTYKCAGPASSFVDRAIDLPLSRQNHVESYNDLITAGWKPGRYNCNMILEGTDGKIKVVDISFDIAPNTSNTVTQPAEIYFTRECNGVPCTTIKPGVQHAANWTTVNTRKLTYKCAGPASSFVDRAIDLPLSRQNHVESYNDLITAGWKPGRYNCNMILEGTDGKIKVVDISFDIAPNTSNTVTQPAEIYFTRECNGVPCTTIKPGVQHAANWTTVNTRKLTYKCAGPASSFVDRAIDLPLSRQNHVESYNDLITAGWKPGRYNCNMILEGTDGKIKVVDISFDIAPNTSNTVTQPTDPFVVGGTAPNPINTNPPSQANITTGKFAGGCGGNGLVDTEYYCGGTPDGNGWIQQPNGCYHRCLGNITTGKFAGGCGGNGLVDTEYYCGGTPDGNGWIQQPNGCYHRCLGNITTGSFSGNIHCPNPSSINTSWICTKPNYGGFPVGYIDQGNGCYHACK